MVWTVSGVDRVREDHLVGCVIDAVGQVTPLDPPPNELHLKTVPAAPRKVRESIGPAHHTRAATPHQQSSPYVLSLVSLAPYRGEA